MERGLLRQSPNYKLYKKAAWQQEFGPCQWSRAQAKASVSRSHAGWCPEDPSSHWQSSAPSSLPILHLEPDSVAIHCLIKMTRPSCYPGLYGNLRTPSWPVYDSISYGSANPSYASLHNTPHEFWGSTDYPRALAGSHSSVQSTPPQGNPNSF